MSTIIMSACWPLQGMSPAQKAVLVSLADQANDSGVCWPAVGTIAARTCLSERAVRDALAWLQAAGAVFREYRHNTSTSYTICPNRFDPSKAPAESKRTTKRKSSEAANAAPPANAATPANAAVPPEDAAPPPANAAPPEGQMPPPNRKGNHQLTPNEPSAPGADATGAAGDLQVLTKEQKTELFKSLCRETWEAYASAYQNRYGTLPVRNEKTNKNVQDIVKRVGKEAPHVATYFVQSINDSFVVRRCHAIGDLLAQCEAYRTQWAVGLSMTSTSAQQADKTQTNLNAAHSAADKARAIIAQRDRDAAEGSNAE